MPHKIMNILLPELTSGNLELIYFFYKKLPTIFNLYLTKFIILCLE